MIGSGSKFNIEGEFSGLVEAANVIGRVIAYDLALKFGSNLDSLSDNGFGIYTVEILTTNDFDETKLDTYFKEIDQNDFYKLKYLPLSITQKLSSIFNSVVPDIGDKTISGLNTLGATPSDPFAGVKKYITYAIIAIVGILAIQIIGTIKNVVPGK